MSSALLGTSAIKLIIFIFQIPTAISINTSSRCPESGVQDNSYDYIIVGGGITGLAVANRLTEDEKTTVFVLERGDFDDSPRVIIPHWANALDRSVMIQPLSAPVSNLNNATVLVPVAAIVGGGSVVNGMGYYRGSKEDYESQTHHLKFLERILEKLNKIMFQGVKKVLDSLSLLKPAV